MPTKLPKRTLLFAFAIVALFSCLTTFGQDTPTPEPTPVDISLLRAEIVEKTDTYEITRTTFDGETTDGDPVVIASRSESKSVDLLVISTFVSFRSVAVFNSSFDSIELTPTDSPSRFLIDAMPGKYLVIVDTDVGSKIRPIVIESSAADYSELTEAANRFASQVNDPPTRADLASTLTSLTYGMSDPNVTLDEAKAKVKFAIDDLQTGVMGRRQGESLKKDWLNLYRRPLQVELDSLAIETVDDFIAAQRAVVAGLEAAPLQSILSTYSEAATISGVVYPIADGNIISDFPAPWYPPPGEPYIGQEYNGRVYESSGCLDGNCQPPRWIFKRRR